MRPPGILIQLDELEYFLPGLYPGVVLAIEGELPFQGLEERLHDGVVVRAALAGKRSDKPAILELPAKPARGVLTAPIRVHYESFFRIFPVHSVIKGVDYQILVVAGEYLPPDYLAREQVEVGGQVEPSFPRGCVGDVAAPHAVPLLDGEFPVQDIGPLVRGLSAPSVLPGAPAGYQPLPRHHALHGLAVRDDADLAKLDDDPPRSVSAIVGVEDVLDERLQASRAICLDDLGRFRKAWYPPLLTLSAPHAFLTARRTCEAALEQPAVEGVGVPQLGDGDEEVAAHAAHLVLVAALLVARAGVAEPEAEVVVGSRRKCWCKRADD